MAKEYIEREYLVKEAEAVLDFRKKYYTDKAHIADAASTVEWLKYYAPAADVVEVVRCKDCRRSRPLWRHDRLENRYGDGCVWCMEHGDGMYEDGFCSDGERRDNDAAD